MTIAETNRGEPAPAPMPEVALLDLMPPDVRRVVQASFTRRNFAFGEVIVTEGEPADALYVLVSGSARALKAGENGAEVPLGVLGPGETLGERALLGAEGRRTATVRASSPVEALRLERDAFDALVSSHPRIREYLELHLRRYELTDFLRAHSAFARLPADGIRVLLEGLEDASFTAGTLVIRQGEPSGPMYIVRRGRLRVLAAGSGREPAAVGYLRAGDFFGEVSLFQGSARTASVEAVSDCELLVLGPSLFERLCTEHPRFREQIEQRVSQYDYRRVARVPLDFAEELLPAAVAGSAPAEDPERGGGDPLPGEAAQQVRRAPRRRRLRLRRRQFPHVYQLDEMDCGAAALAIVCHHFGRRVSLARVRRAVSTATDGTSLLGIARGAEGLGLEARTIKMSRRRVAEMPLPSIIHWEANHWVVLYAVDERHAWLSDPAQGRRRVSRAELGSKWSGYAALLRPAEAFATLPEERSQVGWLLSFFKPFRRALATAFGLALLAAGAEMLIPVISKFVVDRVIRGGDSSLLTTLVLGMFGALGLIVLATVLQRYLLSRVAVRIDRESLDFLSTKLLSLPMSYFNSRRTGDIERRLGGLRQVREFVVQHGVLGLTSATQVVVAVVVMFVFSWPLALVYLATLPLYAALMRFSARRLKPTYDSLEEAWGRYQSRQIDSIRGIETVKAMGAEPALRNLLLGQFDELSGRLFRADLTGMLYESGVQLVSFLSLALFLWLGALEVVHHRLSIGELVSFNALVVLANSPAVTLLALWDQLQYSGILLGRLNDILEHEPEQGSDRARLRGVPTLSGQICFRGVSFAYPGPVQKPVLEQIELDVPPGATVAIVGRSGSGKTTLIKCLSGLLEPTAGSITYDGIDMRELDHRQLRRNIGFVLQENHMFDGTIEENIAFGETDLDRERVGWAARLANAAEFIERLPLGYATPIGESGLLLSGGQRQRIAIARAVYHQPAVLVFDEATSALDSESERTVKENLDRLLEGRTSFVIAHRLSTVRDADIILVLERGRLVEQGDHEELMARRGLYYYLCSQQLEL